MKLDPEVRKELLKMARDCLILSLAMALGFLILGKLNAAAAYGLLIGYALAVGNFFFLSLSVTRALDTGDETAAKRVMLVSRTVRTVVMLAVMGVCIRVWTQTERIHWLPVVAAAFYPRVVIGIRGMLSWYMHRRDPAPEGSAAYGDEGEDEEEREDGVEKFVGRFSKGPVPAVPAGSTGSTGSGEEEKKGAGEDRRADPGPEVKDGTDGKNNKQ